MSVYCAAKSLLGCSVARLETCPPAKKDNFEQNADHIGEQANVEQNAHDRAGFPRRCYLGPRVRACWPYRPRESSSDRTIFYPLGGGQFGDTGTLLRASGERIPIIDTRKVTQSDSVLHVAAPAVSLPEPGETLSLEIDWERRYALMRLHTALHVMSCVIGAPVTGGNIRPTRPVSTSMST
jgi:hypothetical protein